MNLGVAEIMLLLTAVTGSGAMVAMLGWMLTRIRHLERGNDPDALADLAERLQLTEEQLATLREEHAELGERLDFTERLLARGGPEPPASDTTAPSA